MSAEYTFDADLNNDDRAVVHAECALLFTCVPLRNS